MRNHLIGGRRLRVLALVAGLLVVLAAQTAAAATHDYTATRGLSKAIYAPDQIIRESFDVAVPDAGEPDGTLDLYVEVVRPNTAGTQFPVILEASPYHGTLADRDGTRILPEPLGPDGKPVGLTGYFAPRGYAVVMVDVRGTGRSEGCLDHLASNDVSDLRTVIEWAATRSWSNGRVGMTGHSYVGSTPQLAAAGKPVGLVTTVPSAGLAMMYDHQFQGGVPYFLQWAGPMFAYEQLSVQRHLPGEDDELKDLTYAGCGLPNSSLVAGEAQLSGAYAPWHAERDWRDEATAAEIPIFMVHGVNDNAARVPAMQWFTDRQAFFAGRADRPQDKLWLGQWDHGSGCCPTRRGIQWTYALHAWFDKHLAQRRVDTGPPVEVFLTDAATLPAAILSRTEVYNGTTWPGSPTTLEFFPSADGGLGTTAPSVPGSVSFAGDARGFVSPTATQGATFSTAPLSQDTLLIGVPKLRLVASVTTPRVHLIANLFDEDPGGNRRRISQFAINPELRNGIANPQPVLPGVAYTLDPPAFAMAHNLRAGHRLVLRVTTSDPDKVPTFAVDPNVTVYTGPNGTNLQVPHIPGATLTPDTVPLTLGDRRKPKAGTPQPTIRTSVTPVAGAPEKTPLTTAVFEFDAETGWDNARLFVGAVPAFPADIDLFLQRREADGSWTDVTAGTSARLTDELLVAERPPPGHYRVEVHNWAGLPATRVDLTITFVNAAGEPGAGS
jgi:predicted acyl esterase